MTIFDELKPATDFHKQGDCSNALLFLERYWESLPLPKEKTLNSYIAVTYGVKFSLDAKDLECAWKWAQRGLLYSGNVKLMDENELFRRGKVNLMGESEFLAGTVAYEKEDFETARSFFKLTRKMSGKRLFKDEKPEYWELTN